MFSLDFLGRCCLAFVYSVLFAFGLTRVYFSASLLGSAVILPVLIFNAMASALTVMRLPPTRDSSGWPSRAAAILGTVLVWSLALFPLPETGAPGLMRAAAAVIAPLFTAMAVACLFFLGRSFSIDAQARTLRTSGPYRLIRHPLYFCELSALLAIPIANPSFVVVGLWLIIVAIHVLRIRNEEAILTAAFPEYVEYVRRVPMLVPFVKRSSVRAAVGSRWQRQF
jgi:protein-S-isoprenylcysteine O-methyltransferase Ste14